MELIAEKIEDVVVLTVNNPCQGGSGQNCRVCSDSGGLIHNWLVQTELKYLVLDLMDEKDVCATFLVEMVQLRRRLKSPFMFAGIMERPLRILEEYDFSRLGVPIFSSPENAVTTLRELHADAVQSTDISVVRFGEPILSIRARQQLRAEDMDGDEEDAEAEID